ncbi:head completion/stabilization protein [Asticcacaulis solisilvae]|uniref:head completion/stabilization protein n=1 Tax=Asticcacaulis solisilvae TaxID=1217274 RepID=UPI003FD6C528
MTGFISIPPEPASPDGTMVLGEEFWPAVDLNHFRDTMRIGASTIPDARLTEALQVAIADVQEDLADWRATQEAAGYDTLATVPSPPIGAETRLTFRWRRAVYSYATADLSETHQDITATAAGAGQSEAMGPSVGDHRRNALHAIRDILGVGRSTVELI